MVMGIIIKGEDCERIKETRKAFRKEEKSGSSSSIFSWLVLFTLLLPIQACLINFLMLKLRIKLSIRYLVPIRAESKIISIQTP